MNVRQLASMIEPFLCARSVCNGSIKVTQLASLSWQLMTVSRQLASMIEPLSRVPAVYVMVPMPYLFFGGGGDSEYSGSSLISG